MSPQHTITNKMQIYTINESLKIHPIFRYTRKYYDIIAVQQVTRFQLIKFTQKFSDTIAAECHTTQYVCTTEDQHNLQ